MQLRALRKWPVVATAAALVLAGAAACGGSDGGDGKTLTYWASVEGTGTQQTNQTLKPVLKKFEQKTGIHVNYQVIPWSNLQKKILTAVTSGSGPDVVDIGNTWSPSLAATGAFLNFGQETMGKVGGSDRFVKTALRATGLPGKPPMSLPIYGEAYGLFYNKKMFKEAGIAEAPKTWTEFVADAKKLTNAPDRWGMVVEGSSYTEASHWSFVLGQQYGNPLYKEGKPNFATPAMVKAVRRYVDFIGKDKIVNPAAAQYGTSQFSHAFANGDAAMLVAQDITMGSITKLGMKQSEYGIAPMPAPENRSSDPHVVRSHTGGINLAVFKNTEHQKAALKFAKYMTSDAAQTALNKGYGTLPTIKTVYDKDAFKTEKYQAFRKIYQSSSQPMPLTASESQMETSLGNAVVGLIAKAASSGSVTDDDVMAALRSAQQKVRAGS